MSSEFRSLPSVDAVLSDRRVRRLVDEYSHGAVLGLVRARLDDARGAIADGGTAPCLDELVSGIATATASLWTAWPSQVINATGVVLHTNLGRAPLSRAAVEAARQAAAGYSDLELDLDTGRRGSRQAHVQRLLCQLTGGEAALVVNNNASALLIGLSAVAPGREVIVSRGEAIEIGGGFRIPDVMRQSGGTLVEVGTTNRTYVRDFEAAITENTGAILSAHASNFKVTGFTHAPTTEELAELGRRRGVPVLHDLGSGCLLDTTRFGLAREPMPQESVAAGVSLSFFSGDKLLGGPQAGIIVGDRGLVGLASRHPTGAGNAHRQAKPGVAQRDAGPLRQGRGGGGDTDLAHDRGAGGCPAEAGLRLGRLPGRRRVGRRGAVDDRRREPSGRDAANGAAETLQPRRDRAGIAAKARLSPSRRPHRRRRGGAGPADGATRTG